MLLILHGALIAALLRAATGQTPQLTLDECFDQYERGIYPHPEDCNKFMSCATTEPLDCPAGLHFNPINFVCDWPASAGCMKVTTSPPAPVSESATTAKSETLEPISEDKTTSSTSPERDAGTPEMSRESERPSGTITKSPSANSTQSTIALSTSMEPQTPTESKKFSESSTIIPSVQPSHTTPYAQTTPSRSTIDNQEGTSKLTTPSDTQKPTGSDKPSESFTTTPSSQTTASESENSLETTPKITPTESEQSTVKSTTPSDVQKSTEPEKSSEPSTTTPSTALPQTTPSSSEKPSEMSPKPTTIESEEGTFKLTTSSDTRESTDIDTPSRPATTTPSSQTTASESEKPSNTVPEQTPSESDQSTVKPTLPSDVQKSTEFEKSSEPGSTTPSTESKQTTPNDSKNLAESTLKTPSTEFEESTIKPSSPSDVQKSTKSEKPSESGSTTPLIEPKQTTPNESKSPAESTLKPPSTEFEESTIKPTTPSDGQKPTGSEKSSELVITTPTSQSPEITSSNSGTASDTTPKPKLSTASERGTPYKSDKPSMNESPRTTPGDPRKFQEVSETTSEPSPSDSDEKPSSPGKSPVSDKAETTPIVPQRPDTPSNTSPQPNQITETTPISPSGSNQLPPEPTHPSESKQPSESSLATKAPPCDPNNQSLCETLKPPLERPPPTQEPGEAVDLQSRFKQDDNREPLTEPPPAPEGYSLKNCLSQHKFGIYAHDSDPSKFYMCTKMRPLKLTCREGLEFDKESYGCNRPKVTTPMPPPDLRIRECLSKYHRGVFPHPTDCAKFYACSKIGPVEKMCPPGLNFNPNKMVCDWPSKHCVSPAAKTRDLILRSMKRDNIFPDLVDRCPDKLAEVAFPSGGQVDLGKSLTPSQALQPPSIYWEADKRSFYTLCMVDPDASRSEEPSQWNHWMVGNIPGNKISQGQPLAEYLPPCPQQNSPPHRYTYMIYKQPSRLHFQEPRIPANSFQNRIGFNLRNFTQKYQLGQPIAGNYFKCSWDNSVPQTLQRIMFQPPKYSMTIIRPGYRSKYSNSYSYSYSFKSG
ncbi:uncharacterized protein [Euwallacea fornicatus]|uniref:uncharacterized protein isoform X2 n=1 Tax=Euwallacea fornicatus TaxID=995702 RepID=UPI00338F8853